MIKIDALGEVCPIPVIKAKKQLESMQVGEKLLVLVDNLIATENLRKLAKELNSVVEVITETTDNYKVYITKNNFKNQVESKISGNIVVIDRLTMGRGDEVLGKSLMKGFIYSLTEVEVLPSAIIFYNEGVFLPTQNVQTCEDLIFLSEKGVKILICGACLNFYKLENDLKVGEITNMYKIVEMMSVSERIIKP